jgi:uncharacterized DUF497 family protein
VFSWDAAKALRNREKHGVTFDEATTVFADPKALDLEDLRHSEREKRFMRLGESVTGRVLLVIYTVRRPKDEKEIVRIISARQASGKERRTYTGQPD